MASTRLAVRRKHRRELAIFGRRQTPRLRKLLPIAAGVSPRARGATHSLRDAAAYCAYQSTSQLSKPRAQFAQFLERYPQVKEPGRYTRWLLRSLAPAAEERRLDRQDSQGVRAADRPLDRECGIWPATADRPRAGR